MLDHAGTRVELGDHLRVPAQREASLAEVFPATFGSMRRDIRTSHSCAAHYGQRSRHWAAGTPQAFAFEQLSSSSQRNIARNGHLRSSSIEDVSEFYG